MSEIIILSHFPICGEHMLSNEPKMRFMAFVVFEL